MLSSPRLTDNSCWQFLSSALHNHRFKLNQCLQKRERALDGRLAGAGTTASICCVRAGDYDLSTEEFTTLLRSEVPSPFYRGTETQGQLVTCPRPTCGQGLRQGCNRGLSAPWQSGGDVMDTPCWAWGEWRSRARQGRAEGVLLNLPPRPLHCHLRGSHPLSPLPASALPPILHLEAR